MQKTIVQAKAVYKDGTSAFYKADDWDGIFEQIDMELLEGLYAVKSWEQ